MSVSEQGVIRSSLVAGLVAGVFAAGLASAGGASAAPTCPSTTTNIQGKGSALQSILQEKLTGREVPTGEPLGVVPHLKFSPEQGYAKACGTGPTVSFTATSSGNGLEAFHYVGTNPEIDHLQAFVATTDAPSAAQVTRAQEVVGTAKSLVIPVAETSIAVVIHPPSGCKFKTAKGITWKDLNKVFGGRGITKWSQFENVEGTCETAVTRVVRAEASGTTYQFKNYLSVLETTRTAEGLPCRPEGKSKWAELEEIGAAEEPPNVTWPQCSGGTTLLRAAGDGALAQYVQEHAGTIGYTSLPAAKAEGAETPLMQDGEAEGVKQYAAPGKTEGSGAGAVNVSNCGPRVYNVPAAGRVGASGESVDWSKVFGASPVVGGSIYPLCTLTFDLSWTSYSQAGYGVNATSYGAVARDYLDNYVLAPEGQTVANNNWYQKLPNTASPETNVLGAAQLAASKIG